MSKLFVITFKRPAINLEKAIYGEDFTHSYDCEATGIEEEALRKFEEYKANPDYSDVDMFECEDFRYVQFCKMEDAYVHFAKTGEHSMKDDSLEEEINADVEQRPITAQFKYQLNKTVNATFNLQDPIIDELGQVIISPVDPGCVLDGIRLVDEDTELSDPRIDETFKEDYLSVEMVLLTEGKYSFPFGYDIDEIGRLVIYPSQKEDMFISASVNDSLNISNSITESISVGLDMEELKKAVEDPTVRAKVKAILDGKNEKPKQEIEAEVVEEAYNKEQIIEELKKLTENFSKESGSLQSGYESESTLVLECLSEYYDCKSEKLDEWYTIHYSPKTITEALTPGTPEYNVVANTAKNTITEIKETLKDCGKKCDELVRELRKINFKSDAFVKVLTDLKEMHEKGCDLVITDIETAQTQNVESDE